MRVCETGDIEREDVIPVEIDGHSFAVYRSLDDRYYATDGLCTHENTHLANGLVMGDIIECPKHNGRFDYRTGEGKGAPICINLAPYPVKVEGQIVYVDLP
jgi:3-phenylpropionate/trans-cinnamate dioxygenase ferredoxin component